MSTKRTQLITGEIYHINLRAVGNDIVFKNTDDYFRGIFSLYEFNNLNSVSIQKRRQQRKKEKILEKAQSGSDPDRLIDKRDKLVDVIAFCFMPNHIHIVAKQIQDNGISNFMKKVGGGYATYFNVKYKRKGHLFNKFKAIFIEDNNQLRNVLSYVWCNPISLIEPGYKENGIIKTEEKDVLNFLFKEYRWSSLFDSIGQINFSSIISKNLITEFFGEKKFCSEAVENWVKYKMGFNDSRLE